MLDQVVDVDFYIPGCPPTPKMTTGHAQIKENFGFIQHAQQLESLAARLAGFHVHDVKFPDDDHAAPGTGTIDYAKLKPFVKPQHIKVFVGHVARRSRQTRRRACRRAPSPGLRDATISAGLVTLRPRPGLTLHFSKFSRPARRRRAPD